MILPGAVVLCALLLLVQEGPSPVSLLPQPADQPSGGIDRPQDGSGESREARLRVSVSLGPEALAALESITEEWESLHPQWQAELIAVDAAGERGSEAGAQPADIRLLSNRDSLRWASAGKLLPADGLVPQDGGSASAAEASPFAQELRWRGYAWGTPAYADPPVLIWSREALHAAGWSKPPAAWAELERLRAQAPERAAAAIPSADGVHALAWLARWHGEGAPLDPARLEASVLPRPAPLQAPDLTAAGSAAAAVELVRGGGSFSAVVPLSYYRSYGLGSEFVADESLSAAAPLSARGGYGYVIASDTEFPAAAGSWIAAATARSAQERLREAGGLLPANPGLYAAAEGAEAGLPLSIWKQAIFPEEGSSGKPELGRLLPFEPLWAAYGASAGAMSPHQLAQAWKQSIEGSS
ncbi:extracellular solute-binding protein [Paenibacillus albicereus]|uniref:Extracellular solute-binding protein n=1 Tax=Paenibacillus albicereus TaxID=2726185 RepID=A0A6H2GYK9_9BACL|nr:extracellular solute-binding protein [Paenibacillus albicereus]QJC52521.1 extracellular solute-binding protein [Paenibacillus albicereus]